MVAAAAAPDPARTSRPPLTPALDKPNSGAAPRRPARSGSKPVSSRYLASAASPASSTSSTSSSSSSSASSRRSLSAQRGRASTPPPQHATSPTPVAAAATAATVTATTMRSLSVSFQGESFFYQTSRAPRAASPSSPAGRRGPTPERRKSVSSVPEAENARPQHRWPAAKPKASDPLARSLDCNLDRKDSILAAVQLLRRSMAFDSTTSFPPSDHAAAAGPDLSASDTDSVSSGSNSGAGDPPRRGISVPARFWQETNSRLRRLPDAGLPQQSSGRRSFSDSQMSPRLPGRSPSPSRGSKGTASPSRGRAGEASPNGHMVQTAANAPSIISFAAEVRRAKKGENRIEEAHRLRMLDNQHLQWRCINARTDATLLVQSFTAEKTLHSAWKEISKLRDNVSSKRCKLQLQKQKLKLFAILRGEMSYLEEWSHVEKHHSSSLSAAIEALKASTLRLPVVGGAKADAQGVKEAVNSAVDVMHTMASSMCNLLSKVEGTSSVVYELAKLATQEQMLLDQSRDLLSTVAAIHVKQCSLKTHLLQRKQRQSQTRW
ncbi:hypothetical protein CFC21_058527 [Triticum aestivum]|uniref:Protein SNOWY COTYLEDON 3 n=2 Tax=Triticum aestivum TaxID=4565 RepID=A0A9R1GMG4_WHEAT|nr:protein SNOWY COTYLEDON 3-like [Triticum aestivum]KAF7050121.1 hypothetical protein CFC21_058527 [Triticum aestivum]